MKKELQKRKRLIEMYIDNELKKKYKSLLPFIQECQIKTKKLIRSKILNVGKKWDTKERIKGKDKMKNSTR